MNEKAYWIAFNMSPGIGPARLAALIDVCGSVEAAWKAPIRQLKEAGLDRRSLESLLTVRRTVDLDAVWQRVVDSGVRVYTWDDSDYPENLRQIPLPPPVIYAQGQIENDDQLAVALVGTRQASAYGREVTRTLARELAHNGITVVSGLALGIDAVAHETAIEAGGRTIAVLGSGVDQVYPAKNRKIAHAMLERGALVSEYALGTRPEANNFPPRNRIISGLSLAVVVVEAGQRSGALITAKFAADQGREVFAVPGSILQPSSVGCNALIQDGALPLLSINDLLDQLQMERVTVQREARRIMPTDPTEQHLLEQLTTEPTHLDEIARSSGLAAAQVSGLLAMLELKGMVRQVSTMRYVRG